MASPYGEEEEVDYSNEIDYGNGGWEGSFPESSTPSSVRLDSLVGAAAIGGVIGGLAKGSKGAIVGAAIGAGVGAISNLFGAPDTSFMQSSGQGNATTATTSKEDWRVRLSMANSTADVFINSSPITAPLKSTNGLVFPSTPSVAVSHQANYGSMSPTHSIYKTYFYQNSEVAPITITGEFAIQTITEGKYLVAAIHFLRAVTKMFYGESNFVGNPPPVLFLDGYGSFYFPHVPCVLQNFTHNMDSGVDYVRISGIQANSDIWLPTISTISITLLPVYSRNSVSTFSIQDFVNGSYITTNKTGGFL